MKINNEALNQDIPVVANQEGDFKYSRISDLTKKLMWFSFPQIDHNYSIASFDQAMLFMVKLYSFLAGMILSLYLMIVILYFCDDFRWSLIQITSATIFYWTNMMFTIGLGFIINIFRSTRKFPFNIIFYIVFSFCIGLLLGAPIATNLRAHKQGFIIILYLFCMTIGTFACIIIFTFKKWILDKSNYILVLIFLVMVFLLIIFFFTMKAFLGVLIGGAICHVIYSFLMLFEAQMIMHGKFLLKTNEFIGGALLFYIDITVFIIYLSFTAVITLIVGFCIALGQACAHIN
ncbi:unnamed protein product [Paramecium pentaurelia]|uniref:Uncharacterized protein n=1 Tax=Paramecium pentaurelia TaxID=43138 RepID=A0A8S1XX66_9CILI|nr:unnamed protein product [Paramecium pentaurelia]